ncbi:MAG: HDOD domain-containing protein, partial [Deltaproteobacteria bacterium]|nr:HDOD domain-containing protein [Deltaproteobacteria bacterium]
MNKTTQQAFNDIIGRMTGLPSLPETVVAILEVLNNPDSSAKELSEALQHDQSIASRVLKLVNSAFYGFPRQIDTLSKAVTILGYTSIQNIILATSIFNTFSKAPHGPVINRKKFWAHALGCGVVAQTIKVRLGMEDGEEVFLAGLLHDIGKVILDAFLPDEYAQVIKLAQEKNLLLVEAEKEILGATHADFGLWLSENWNLPHNLTAAIAHHHDPPESKTHFTITSLIHVGDIIVRIFEVGHGGDDLVPAINPQAWTALRLNPKFIEGLIPEFKENF